MDCFERRRFGAGNANAAILVPAFRAVTNDALSIRTLFRGRLLKWPSPIDNLGLVDAVLVDIVAAVELLIQQCLACV